MRSVTDRHNRAADTMSRIRCCGTMMPLLLLLALLSDWPHHVMSARVEYTLTISSMLLAPDCFTRRVLAVNNTVPGPVLTARSGDTMAVTVCNASPDQPLSMHWHGIHQIGTPYYDGVAGVTQCTIDSGGACMLYEFQIGDQFGSYFYHAHHVALSADGVFGAIIIYDAALSDPSKLRAAPANAWRHQSKLADSSATNAAPLTFMGRPIMSAATPSAIVAYSELTWMLNDWYVASSLALHSRCCPC